MASLPALSGTEPRLLEPAPLVEVPQHRHGKVAKKSYRLVRATACHVNDLDVRGVQVTGDCGSAPGEIQILDVQEVTLVESVQPAQYRGAEKHEATRQERGLHR